MPVVLLVKGINQSKRLKTSIPTNPHDLVEKYACDSNLKGRMSGECTLCDEKTFDFDISTTEVDDSGDDSTSSCGSSDQEEDDDTVTYYRWQKDDNDKIAKLKITQPYEDALDLLNSSIVELKVHIHCKRVQNTIRQEQKDALGPKDLLLHVDFSESYKNKNQDEIHSAYFGGKCFSIFTACAYYRLGTDVLSDSITVITESSEHDRSCALSCIRKVIEKVETVHDSQYDSIEIWSDGCSAQFRSRYVFHLCATAFITDKNLSWNYNERHHGKGPMDGVGGTLKRTVFNAVKSKKVVINSPEEFAMAAESLVEGIHTVYMTNDEILV